MKAILDGWPRTAKNTKLGQYLHGLLPPGDDVSEIVSFATYRATHQILGQALKQPGEEARAIEAVRCIISHSGSEATKVGNGAEIEPIVEYSGVGQLVALSRASQEEEISASSSIALSAYPDFFYRETPTSEAIFLQRDRGATFNLGIPMLAVTIQDATYGVAAPGLQWDVRLALVWTRSEVLGADAPLKLAFQWRFHEHPHPLQLLKWSREWREFVRDRWKVPKQKVERIAYAWIYYQLKWLEAQLNNTPCPSKIGTIGDADWDKLLEVEPTIARDEENGSLGTQDWKTQTLPLLARPEIGLRPGVAVSVTQRCGIGRGSESQRSTTGMAQSTAEKAGNGCHHRSRGTGRPSGGGRRE